jgi:hypothetical protein
VRTTILALVHRLAPLPEPIVEFGVRRYHPRRSTVAQTLQRPVLGCDLFPGQGRIGWRIFTRSISRMGVWGRPCCGIPSSMWRVRGRRCRKWRGSSSRGCGGDDVAFLFPDPPVSR